MRPLIGITTTIAPSGRHGLPQVMAGAQYAAAVERAGGIPLFLAPTHGRESLDRLCALATGLLLPGGEDVDPSLYGQPPSPALEPTNPSRDATELSVLRVALTLGLPILAICRGMQLLNVAFGGTLHQDLPGTRSGGLEHRQRGALHETWHAVRLATGSGLSRLLGVDALEVNSFHHQGIDRLGERLRAVAWSEDDLIEGVEAEDGRWIYGVQWHPERSLERGATLLPNRRLFEGLVAAARGG